MVRVLLIDDSDALRRVLRRTLETEPSIEVVGDANCGEAGLAFVAETAPDVVVVDGMMPGMDGPQTIRSLLALRPHTRVVGYSGHNSLEYALLDAGADVFVLKGTPFRELVSAIERVAALERTGEPR